MLHGWLLPQIRTGWKHFDLVIIHLQQNTPLSHNGVESKDTKPALFSYKQIWIHKRLDLLCNKMLSNTTSSQKETLFWGRTLVKTISANTCICIGPLKTLLTPQRSLFLFIWEGKELKPTPTVGCVHKKAELLSWRDLLRSPKRCVQTIPGLCQSGFA